MKKIGFVDYYLSEWHAKVYPGWIKEICEEHGLDFTVAYAYGEQDVSPADGKTTDDWCKEYGIEKCDTIDELCEKSDYILVLAPSNPETHLRFAEKVLKFGKRTYIDKTFAPDAATAKKIYELGDKYGAELFSTSALRYADELKEFKGRCDAATVFGGGSNLPEYIIHQVEILVCLMGIGAAEVRAERSADQYVVRVKYSNGRTANIVYADNYGLPTGFVPHTAESGSAYYQAKSPFFKNLLKAILDFYATGKVPFAREETIEVMKIREKIIAACKEEGCWIKI